MKQFPLFIGVCLLGGIIPLRAATDESQYVRHPDQDKKLTEIQGQIKAIDASGRQLTVQDHAGQTVTIHAAAEARVLDAENHEVEWISLRPGDNVLVYYNTQDLTTLQIDLRPTVADVLMGEPKH